MSWPHQFHGSDFYFSGNVNYLDSLEMNGPETQCSVSVMGMQCFLLAEVLSVPGVSVPGPRGALWPVSGPGMAWPGLPLPRLVGDLPPRLCTLPCLCHVTSCVFAAGAGTRVLNLVGLHSFLLHCQPWLLGTSSGAGVFAGQTLTPAVSFVGPAFLLNTDGNECLLVCLGALKFEV